MSDDNRIVLADGFQEAFIGIVKVFDKPVSVYDREKCILILHGQGMDLEEAEDFFSYNTEGAWIGDQTPLFLVQEIISV